MSQAEVKTARPLRIKVVRVGDGDTVERLAGRMAIDRPVERFRVLNGLGPNDRIRPGDSVKIVVE
jgi:predicted Zn-dependent protease